jgi:hypothetical protein
LHDAGGGREYDAEDEWETDDSFKSLFRAGSKLQAEREAAAHADESSWYTSDEEMRSSSDSPFSDEVAVESFDPKKEGYMPLQSVSSTEVPADNTKKGAETERHVIFGSAIKYDTSKKRKGRNGLGALNWA